MSLRARLALVTVGLVAAGLLIADVATYRALATFLLRPGGRTARAGAAVRGRGDPTRRRRPADAARCGRRAVRGPRSARRHVRRRSSTHRGNQVFADDPELPRAVHGALPSIPTTGGDGRDDVHPEATEGSTRFRAQTSPLQGAGAARDRDPARRRRPRRSGGSSRSRSLVVDRRAAVVAARARPLARPRRAAAARGHGRRPPARSRPAISHGASSRPTTDTEVGRLGLALNAMLAQIEEAFDERRASEDRLRRFVGRRLARAADAAHVDPRLRGAVPPRRRPSARRTSPPSMARIEAEAERMGVLVDDLLLLARLDQGRPLEQEPVDLAPCRARRGRRRSRDRPRPRRSTSTRRRRCDGDRRRGRLRQVVDNLLDERARPHPARHAGRRRACGRTTATTSPSSVADDGPGHGPPRWRRGRSSASTAATRARARATRRRRSRALDRRGDRRGARRHRPRHRRTGHRDRGQLPVVQPGQP